MVKNVLAAIMALSLAFTLGCSEITGLREVSSPSGPEIVRQAEIDSDWWMNQMKIVLEPGEELCILLKLADGDAELVEELLAGDNAHVTQKLPGYEYQTEETGLVHLDVEVGSGSRARYRFSAVVEPETMTEFPPIVEWRE